MKIMQVTLLKEVGMDLEQGRFFYNSIEPGIGDYFFDSLIADIESLRFFAGIHSKPFGLFQLLSKRFPFAIYYKIDNDTVTVHAVLDMRRDPAWVRSQLETRIN